MTLIMTKLDFSEIQRDWIGKACFIIGGGYSIAEYKDRLNYLNALGKVIAVNDSYKHCTPDVVFSLDYTWMEKRKSEFSKIKSPIWLAVDTDYQNWNYENAYYIHRRPRNGRAALSEDNTAITNGLNSGFGAFNFAFLKGAKTIFLMGFDFKAGNNGSHYHDGYAWHNKENISRWYPRWASLFSDTLPQLYRDKVTVYNCNKDSLLKIFPYFSHEQIFSFLNK